MNTKLSVFCEKVLEAGWLAAVVAVPLFFNIYSARTFEPDKITLLRSITAVMILAWLVMVVERGRLGSGETGSNLGARFREILRIPLFIPTLAMVLVYIISTIFSLSPQVSLWGSYQRLQGTYSFLSYIVVGLFIAGNLRSREQVDRLVTIAILASIPVSLYGIIQRYGLDPLPWAGDVTRRVASNMGNAIFVASYLIMIMPITITRLIESMKAIVTEDNASWGHTILAAVYIFALAVQTITVIFSLSRGPMLGILGAAFVMGLILILILRQVASDTSRLNVKEIATGLGFMLPLGLAAGLMAGLGYAVGFGLDALLLSLNYQLDYVPFVGAMIGGLLGFLGLYTYMAVAERGWRWLWVSWIGIAAVAIAFVLALNIRGTNLDTWLDPVRELPYFSRLARITQTEGGTGKVRVYIWDAAMELVAPHQPLGIEEDSVAAPDRFNFLRPLIGYGPESMFNAFAYVYPPGLAHVETRGSSADRSHNETMDSLVITGVVGFLAFYLLMGSIFYYALVWLGWAPDQVARYRLLALMVLAGLVGAIIPYLVQGRFTFMPIGLPFGLMTGVVLHLIWQGITQQSAAWREAVEASSNPELHLSYTLLLIGLLGAIIGHFIEVHFVFSIAATYTYFWAYVGLMVALYRMAFAGSPVAVEEAGDDGPAMDTPAEPAVEAPAPAGRRSKRSRRSRGNGRKPAASSPVLAFGVRSETWETLLGTHGLSMAIILIILAFNFITPQFEFSLGNTNTSSFFWIVAITWLIGFAIALSTVAIRIADWKTPVSWGRAVLLYSITSLSYFLFYTMAHRIQFGRRITVTSLDDVIRAASVLTNGFILFYVFLLLLLMIMAITLSWRQMRGLPTWRAENWWLYPPLAIAVLAVIWFKNIDVVRADIYLKEGERYRNQRQWNEAIALHERARSLDSDEDFYYLMLALDYQLMAQDGNVDQAVRQQAWQQGEQIALAAREINPYNPDNTGNMGRYYFTLGQVFSQDKFQDALDFFRKATVLAPSNVTYHNLWAQTHYILQNYDAAIDRLQTSVSIDGKYAPSWILLGDTYAAKGDVDHALEAHAEGMGLQAGGSDGWSVFADQFLDQRLNFYISSGRADDIIAAMQQVSLVREEEMNSASDVQTRQVRAQELARIQWAIGHAYELQGQRDKAIPYFERARQLGDNSARTARSLANIYLAANDYEQAIPNYQEILQQQPNDVEAHSALAYIYAQQGRLDEAIGHNQMVLQQAPNDYDSLKNLAILFQQKGDLQQSLDAARQAQAAAPETERASWDQFVANLESQLNQNN